MPGTEAAASSPEPPARPLDPELSRGYSLAMAEAPENLVLGCLRRIDGKVDRLVEDMHEVKQRLSMLERQHALVEEQFASLSPRMDRVDQRIERIERRLDLIPTP